MMRRLSLTYDQHAALRAKAAEHGCHIERVYPDGLGREVVSVARPGGAGIPPAVADELAAVVPGHPGQVGRVGYPVELGEGFEAVPDGGLPPGWSAVVTGAGSAGAQPEQPRGGAKALRVQASPLDSARAVAGPAWHGLDAGARWLLWRLHWAWGAGIGARGQDFWQLHPVAGVAEGVYAAMAGDGLLHLRAFGPDWDVDLGPHPLPITAYHLLEWEADLLGGRRHVAVDGVVRHLQGGLPALSPARVAAEIEARFKLAGPDPAGALYFDDLGFEADSVVWF